MMDASIVGGRAALCNGVCAAYVANRRGERCADEANITAMIAGSETSMFDVTGPRRYSAAFAVSLVLLCGPSAAQVPPNPSSVTRPGVGSAPAAASAQPHNEQVVLAPHRAVYEISLDQSRNAGSVTDMSGRMVYELTGSACEGWSQSMRFVSDRKSVV